jgi:hypothetical protein
LAGDGFSAISRGLGASYEAARTRAFVPVASLSEEAYHEWRKYVQQHWRHMQLLSQAWPEELGARVVASRELSELLGQDHDLALLRDLLERDSARYGKERAVQETVKLIVSEQGRLREIARPMAQRLFAEPTASFTQRMRRYWKTSRRIRKALKKSR